MKFLILSQYAGSARHGMVLRNYNWARALVEMGHEVTVVASAYSHSRRHNPDAGREIIDGIEYIWLRGVKYDAAGKWGRVAAMAVYTLRAFFVRGLPKADVVICSSPQPFAIYPARYFAKKFGTKLVFDVRDLWPMTLKMLGGVSARHPFVRAMQAAEDYACKHADVVASVPALAQEYFVSRGMDADKFLPVLNGVLSADVASDDLPPEHAGVLNDLRAKGAFIVGYAGAFGTANALHVLIEALVQAPSHVQAVFVGLGPDKDALINLAAQRGVDGRVHFLPPISHKQVDTFLRCVDVGYLGLLLSPVFAYGTSPTKLNDYMRVGVPVLYAVSEPESIVKRSGCGIECAGEDVNGVAVALSQLAQMPDDVRREMGARGRTWLLENNMVSTHMERLITRLLNR